MSSFTLAMLKLATHQLAEYDKKIKEIHDIILKEAEEELEKISDRLFEECEDEEECLKRYDEEYKKIIEKAEIKFNEECAKIN
jgi:hypothetical protein